MKVWVYDKVQLKFDDRKFSERCLALQENLNRVFEGRRLISFDLERNDHNEIFANLSFEDAPKLPSPSGSEAANGFPELWSQLMHPDGDFGKMFALLKPFQVVGPAITE